MIPTMVHWRVISWISVTARSLMGQVASLNAFVVMSAWDHRDVWEALCTWWESVFLCQCTHLCFPETHTTKQSEKKQNLGWNQWSRRWSISVHVLLTVDRSLQFYQLICLTPKMETVVLQKSTKEHVVGFHFAASWLFALCTLVKLQFASISTLHLSLEFEEILSKSPD